MPWGLWRAAVRLQHLPDCLGMDGFVFMIQTQIDV